MRSTKISRRYAKALMSLGREDGSYRRYGEELKEFSSLAGPGGELSKALAFRLYPLEERRAVLEAVLEKSGFSGLVKNFLRLLLKKERMAALPEIVGCHRTCLRPASQTVSTPFSQRSSVSSLATVRSPNRFPFPLTIRVKALSRGPRMKALKSPTGL